MIFEENVVILMQNIAHVSFQFFVGAVHTLHIFFGDEARLNLHHFLLSDVQFSMYLEKLVLELLKEGIEGLRIHESLIEEVPNVHSVGRLDPGVLKTGED